MNCSSCQQEQEYKRLVTLLPFTQTDWSSVPSLAASIRYIALGRARRWTTSVRQRGCGSLRLFGDGSLTFHGNVMLLPPLEWRKVSHRSPERDLTSKERIGNSVSDSLQCVGLRYLSLLQIVWQRAYLHGYGSKCWTIEHFSFFFREKHTSVSSQCLMVPVRQAGEIRLYLNLAGASKKCFRVQGEK